MDWQRANHPRSGEPCSRRDLRRAGPRSDHVMTTACCLDARQVDECVHNRTNAARGSRGTLVVVSSRKVCIAPLRCGTVQCIAQQPRRRRCGAPPPDAKRCCGREWHVCSAVRSCERPAECKCSATRVRRRGSPSACGVADGQHESMWAWCGARAARRLSSRHGRSRGIRFSSTLGPRVGAPR